MSFWSWGGNKKRKEKLPPEYEIIPLPETNNSMVRITSGTYKNVAVYYSEVIFSETETEDGELKYSFTCSVIDAPSELEEEDFETSDRFKKTTSSIILDILNKIYDD